MAASDPHARIHSAPSPTSEGAPPYSYEQNEKDLENVNLDPETATYNGSVIGPGEKVLKDAGSAHEVGLDLYEQADGVDIYGPDAKRVWVLRKIDWWILPIFCVTQGLSYLDKTALNYGNLWGMKAGLHVTTEQFNWFASAFYLGFLVASWPMNLILQKYHTGRAMGIICFFWGVLSACTAACHNFSGSLVVRILLGMLESAVTPGLGLMTPVWWKLNEQPVRHLTWYCMNGVASIIGSLVSYGLGHATSSAVSTWKLIFIVFGSLTCLWGIYMLFFLPDSPASARWLTKAQKIIAIKRVATNRTGVKNTSFKKEQMIEAFMDPKTYILFLASIAAQIPNGIVSNFSTIIIQSLGFDRLQTTLLDIPSNVVQIVSLILSGYIAGRFKNCRILVMFLGNASCIVAAAVLTYAPQDQKWLRLVFYWFTNLQSVGFAMSLVMISANVAGETKRRTVNALIFIAYCVGNIAGPHVLIGTEASRGYPTATKSMMSAYAAKTGLHLIFGGYLYWSNRRLNKLAAEAGENLSEDERKRLAEQIGMTDATEWHNPYFRYEL